MTVDDPFGVASDPVLTTLARATDPPYVQKVLGQGVEGLAPPGAAELRAIRVIRFKPARRCLIEYDLVIHAPGRPNGRLTAIGKVRRNRPGRHQLRLQQALWAAGFDDASADGISVPEPLGAIPELHMWLQRRVAGAPATELMGGGGALAGRLVDAADKIHRAGVRTRKRHTIEDELGILEGALRAVARERPALAGDLDRLLGRCARAAATVAPGGPAGIHRDFYPDQVVVDGERLHVLDFDLYTRGEPALDVGNLVGHVAEQSLRELGDADARLDVEEAAGDRAAAVMGAQARHTARVYGALTLARHVFVASERPERAHLVEELVDAARTRLARLAA